eukprot:RCo038581
MQLFVKTLTGKTVAINVDGKDSVADVKSKIFSLEGIPEDLQCLIFGGKQLLDESTLEESGVEQECILNLTVRLLGGGGKKKKKKVYTKPKKNKHKKKKTPLAVLKFYKVDDDGNITRTRIECPHPDCGAGVFMAAHKDRQYCGKCALTYVFQKEE